jgi:sugar O-acyltransferase (sialic acid O-acetyltransferase NeuD family)
VAELQAGANGYVYLLTPHGKPARFGETVALVHDRNDLSDLEISALVEPTSAKPSDPGVPRWTAKARLLAEAKGIPLGSVQAAGDVVRESDVLAYLERAGSTSRPASTQRVPGALKGRDLVDDAYPQSRPQRVLVIGGGYGAVQVLDALQRQATLRAVGVVDDNPELAGALVMGVPILGTVGQAAALHDEGRFDAAVISVGTSREFRRRVFNDLRSRRVPFANVVDPSATIHANATLGQGNVILAHCMIGACASIGDNNFLSAHVSLDHHSQMGSHCTFGPAVVTSALVQIGDSVKFGTGIFIEPKVTIGDDCIIGSGAILVAPVPAMSLVRTRVTSSIEPLPRTGN